MKFSIQLIIRRQRMMNRHVSVQQQNQHLVEGILIKNHFDGIRLIHLAYHFVL